MEPDFELILALENGDILDLLDEHAGTAGGCDADWEIAGVRASLAKTRLVGPDRAAVALSQIREALQLAGLGEGRVTATFADSDEEPSGRGLAARGMIADAMVRVAGIQATDLEARMPSIDPDEAISVEPDGKGCIIRVSYMGDGMGYSDARGQLIDLLRDVGIETEEV